MNVFLIILSTWILSFQLLPEPEATFLLENGSPLVGEPVILTLQAVFPGDIVIAEWPALDQEWEQFSIEAISDMTSESLGDGTTRYEQVYTLRAWYPGEYSTPEVNITYQTTGDEASHELPVEAAFLSVPSVLEGVEQATLNPLKPQIWLPYISPFAVIGIVLAVGAVGYMGYRYAQRQRQTFQPEAVVEIPGPQSPGQIALLELKRIYQQNAPPTVMIALVSQCLRTYIEQKLGVPALDLTSDELLDREDLHSQIEGPQQETLERLLRQADLVKFAQYQPTER
ncbi:MAG: hypothetical protein K8L99_04800, partial [Anaerolineae bacterium]|nr:hypothetical protein [Anaerolineae bacterium]